MTPSQKCVDLVKQFEGCKLEAYQDQRGIWTIGYGRIQGVKAGMNCTEEDAEHWLLVDIDIHCADLANLVIAPLNQNQLDALTSLVYNIGIGHFGSSTLLKFLNAKDYANAASQFLVWNKTNGTENAGLTRRRQAEHDLFVS